MTTSKALSSDCIEMDSRENSNDFCPRAWAWIDRLELDLADLPDGPCKERRGCFQHIYHRYRHLSMPSGHIPCFPLVSSRVAGSDIGYGTFHHAPIFLTALQQTFVGPAHGSNHGSALHHQDPPGSHSECRAKRCLPWELDDQRARGTTNIYRVSPVLLLSWLGSDPTLEFSDMETVGSVWKRSLHMTAPPSEETHTERKATHRSQLSSHAQILSSLVACLSPAKSHL